MRICTNCHTENPSKASHCMNCGSLLVDGAELPEEVILRRELKEAKETIDLLKRSLADMQKQMENAIDNTEFQALYDKANEYKRTILVLHAQIEKKNNEISDLSARLAECQKKNGGKWGYIFVVLFIVAFLSLVVTGVLVYDFSGRIDYLKYDLGQKEIEINDSKGFVSKLGYVDLGLPSGTWWKNENESGFYDYDAAVRSFGSKLPTEEQFDELRNYCTWKRTGDGYEVVGPSGASIVLPAAGYRYCNGDVGHVGSYGRYWSSTPDGSDNAWSLYFYSSRVGMDNGNRCSGPSVRLVQD